MCGIVGFVNFKKDISNDDVRHLNINLIGNKYLNILD